MKIDLKNLTINQKLAILALSLGFIAMFMNDPLKSSIVKVNATELASKVQDKSSNITVEELADWLIQKKADFTLIDLRSEKLFNEYNIPSSVNMKVNDVISMQIPKSSKIILYSDDNLQSAQAWFLLKSKRFSAVYLLKGGFTEWTNKILFPTLTESASPEEKANFAKISEISKYFGGSPRIQTGGVVQTEMPKMAMPKVAAPSAGNKQTRKKPKREGC